MTGLSEILLVRDNASFRSMSTFSGVLCAWGPPLTLQYFRRTVQGDAREPGYAK